MNRILFIYNTYAGKGRVGLELANVQEVLSGYGTLTVHPTRGAGDACQLVAQYGGQYDSIVCSGGDGTLHEVVEGLLALPKEQRPPVGYIPAGTTNDFAKNLQLPVSMTDMANVAVQGTPKEVDMGRFNEKNFLYVAAFGLFTDVSYTTPQPAKNALGHLAYVLEGAMRLTAIPSYDLVVEHDTGTVEGNFIYGMVSNTISVGGFKTKTPQRPVLDDGLFEVVLVRKPTNPAQIQALVFALLQESFAEDDGVMIAIRTSKLTISSEQAVPWTLDGEYGGCPLVADIENLNQAVTLRYGI